MAQWSQQNDRYKGLPPASSRRTILYKVGTLIYEQHWRPRKCFFQFLEPRYLFSEQDIQMVCEKDLILAFGVYFLV
jgi:hypothetical protein